MLQSDLVPIYHLFNIVRNPLLVASIHTTRYTTLMKTAATPSQPGTKGNRKISWYRSPIDTSALKVLSERSNLLGFLQALTHLLLIAAAAVGAVYFQLTERWIWMMICVILYGSLTWFTINAVHELVHGTVFRSKSLNKFFADLFGLIGINNHYYFWLSHKEHHRYTLHQPDDLEVVEPEKPSVRHFLLIGIVALDPRITFDAFRRQWGLITKRFPDEWTRTVMESASEPKRREVVRFARLIILTHILVGLVAVSMGAWIVPVFFTLQRQFGGLPFFLCNSTQHAGLQDEVPDFRLCCRTIYLNPVLQFLYWHMNYHIEHHMFASVPCYRLGRLHRAIKADLPPTANGLVESWREIGQIIQRQKKDPTYRYVPPVPGTDAPEASRSPQTSSR